MSMHRSTLAALLAAGVASMVASHPAQAHITNSNANLTGGQETPPNGSPGAGFGAVTLDDIADTITVNENWVGLVAPATASHIHTGAVGVAGPVTFALAGVPNATA